MKTRLNFDARHVDATARSGLPAPRFWPTSVAAALPSPQDGSQMNSNMRRPIVYAATAVLLGLLLLVPGLALSLPGLLG